MTPVERALRMFGHGRLVGRLRANLPSRKPQLWERLPRALYRRAYLALGSRFSEGSPERSGIAGLPEFDVVMECSPRESVLDVPLYLYGVYEISGTRFLEGVLKPGETVIDVGANSGYYSLIAARLVGDRGHVHAFEPVAGPVQRLRRNLELNGFQNITIIRAVVGRENGLSIVYPSTIQNNDGLGSVLPGPSRAVIGEEVRMTSLDHFVRELSESRVALVKIDVEGAEGAVLAGARNLLSQPDAPALLFESFDAPPIEEHLAEFGYEVRHVHFSLQNGLEFPRVGEAFDNLFSAYEAPNFVALKPGGLAGSFQEISNLSRSRVPRLLRLLAKLA